MPTFGGLCMPIRSLILDDKARPVALRFPTFRAQCHDVPAFDAIARRIEMAKVMEIALDHAEAVPHLSGPLG